MQKTRTDGREERNARRRVLRAANLEERRAYDREWYARNRDRLAAKRVARDPEQVERERAGKRDYYHRYKAKRAPKVQEYREANREQIAAYYRAYNEAHREANRARSRAYYWVNQDRILTDEKALRAAARARKQKAQVKPSTTPKSRTLTQGTTKRESAARQLASAR